MNYDGRFPAGISRIQSERFGKPKIPAFEEFRAAATTHDEFSVGPMSPAKLSSRENGQSSSTLPTPGRVFDYDSSVDRESNQPRSARLGSEEEFVHTNFYDSAKPGVSKAILVTQHASANFVDRYYEKVKQIGKGTFGCVTLVRDCKTRTERVCKDVDFGTSKCDKPQKLLELTRQEIKLLAELDHPHIVKLHECCEDLSAKRLVLILEHIEGGDCHALLAKVSQGLQEALVCNIIHQTFVALAYCHGRGVLHRDVKSANILLKKTSQWGCPMIVLVDFGLATQQPSAGEQVSTSGEFVGTPTYFAPEVVALKNFSTKSDVWAAAILAIELLTGKLPFGGAKDHQGDVRLLFRTISNYRTLQDLQPMLGHLPGWTGRSAEASRFLSRVMDTDPYGRPSARQAAMDPWCHMHGNMPIGLTSQMVQSLANYVDAPSPVRCCLLAIAVRTNVPDHHHFGSAFLAADVDGDGKISQGDLSEAIAAASNWWDPELDAHALIEIADLDRTGGLSFSEFVAACLYDREGSLEQLAEDAFTALDTNRDDKISVQDVRNVFPELENSVLRRLPQRRFISRSEWCRHLVAACTAIGGTMPGQGTVLSCGGELMPCPPPQNFDLLQCGQLPPNALQPLQAGCEGLNREVSESESDANAPARPRRMKKAPVECWGFSCVGED